MTFLQTGTTRRDAVISKLGRIDTGFSNPRVFWGRWSDSKWGSWVIIPTPTAVGGGGRNWRVHNLLVDFNDSGTVQTHELIDDEKALERKLRELLAQAPPLDLAHPVQIKLTPHSEGWALEGPKELTLDKEAVQYGSVKISTPNVVRISYERFYGNPRWTQSVTAFIWRRRHEWARSFCFVRPRRV